MIKITPDNKQIAKRLLNAFGGGNPKVQQYNHDNAELHIDILSIAGNPDVDITSYGTIGLSDFLMPWGNGEFPTRIELCGASLTSFIEFPNVVASAAFNIIRSGIVCHPSLVMRDYVKEYNQDTQLPHLYFTSPFFWEDDLKTVTLSEKTVSWLLCFPISEAEAEFLSKKGEDSFESLLENQEIDIFDTSRQSANTGSV
ncbi:MAG: suppressor of fused domain protein [Proteobacteria bacterium]|nr:suppressor of fused domain protein [Pseudomonadota bacterium]